MSSNNYPSTSVTATTTKKTTTMPNDFDYIASVPPQPTTSTTKTYDYITSAPPTTFDSSSSSRTTTPMSIATATMATTATTTTTSSASETRDDLWRDAAVHDANKSMGEAIKDSAISTKDKVVELTQTGVFTILYFCILFSLLLFLLKKKISY